MSGAATRPKGLQDIDREMARQREDAIASYEAARAGAGAIAASLKRTGSLLLLGMGGSHAVSRAVEPLYRAAGFDAIALPLSEQLGQPLSIKGKTVIITSQSGESAEVLRWFRETGGTPDTFGLTLEQGSFLAGAAQSLVGTGGTERAFAATRSLTITFALHMAIFDALGVDVSDAVTVLTSPQEPDLTEALAALSGVFTVVTSGRRLQGVAEALALGLTELSRRPCFSLEGGQLRHGPMEMLSPNVGVVLFRGRDHTTELVTAMATSVAGTDAPLVVFDTSGAAPVEGAVTVSFRPADGLAAIFSTLPAAQRLMVAFAEERVPDAGTPVRSSKITRSE